MRQWPELVFLTNPFPKQYGAQYREKAGPLREFLLWEVENVVEIRKIKTPKDSANTVCRDFQTLSASRASLLLPYGKMSQKSQEKAP